jgi:hypothetical protein
LPEGHETLSIILFQTICPPTRQARRSGHLAASPGKIATALVIAGFLLTPMPASALSVRAYENATKSERADKVAAAIDKIIADVARVNPDLSKAIHDYFYVTPAGQSQAPGVIAFGAELLAVEKMADNGKLDRDKVQIEGILLDIVKTDVLKKQAAKQPEKN